MATMNDLNKAIAKLREDSRVNATRSGYPVIRSRGAALFVYKIEGSGDDKTTTRTNDGDLWDVSSTLRAKDIDAFLESYPETTHIDIEGGHDGHETIEWDDNYEPWISTWEARIWDRDGLRFTHAVTY